MSKRAKGPAQQVLRMVSTWFCYSFVAVIILVTTAAFLIKLRLVLISFYSALPQAALVLGGDHRREPTAAKLATENPSLEIWVSSGLPSSQAQEIFLEEGISLARIHLDYEATDTVTNFTTIAGKLKNEKITHIYLVTSDFHMSRATAIAFWILGSRGIAYTPVTVPSNRPLEPHHKILRDVARSWLWLLTGRTGSSLDPNPPVRSSS